MFHNYIRLRNLKLNLIQIFFQQGAGVMNTGFFVVAFQLSASLVQIDSIPFRQFQNEVKRDRCTRPNPDITKRSGALNAVQTQKNDDRIHKEGRLHPFECELVDAGFGGREDASFSI